MEDIGLVNKFVKYTIIVKTVQITSGIIIMITCLNVIDEILCNYYGC